MVLCSSGTNRAPFLMISTSCSGHPADTFLHRKESTESQNWMNLSCKCARLVSFMCWSFSEATRFVTAVLILSTWSFSWRCCIGAWELPRCRGGREVFRHGTYNQASAFKLLRYQQQGNKLQQSNNHRWALCSQLTTLSNQTSGNAGYRVSSLVFQQQMVNLTTEEGLITFEN